MNPARFTVKRPVFTIMVTLIVMLLGGISLIRLPVDLMPDISYPTLSVSTRYENASPEEVEEMVTRPVEQALSAVPGVEEVSSVSAEGVSNVRVTFTWGTNLDAAANDVRDRLDRITARLPDDADRPSLRKFDLAAFPILILGASSDLDPVTMRQMIEDIVQYRIERVPGVASLDVWGGLRREVQVDLDLDRVRAQGLPLDSILGRIRAANVDRPAGTIRDGHLDLRVRVPGYYRSIEELAATVISGSNQDVVRLSDVAEVLDAWEKPSRIIRVNGQPGVRLAVNKQSGTHTVEIAREVLREVERINRDLPQIRIVPIVDSSRFIQRSITNVANSAMFGGLLAIIVLLFFLCDLRATIVIATAIPVSIVATFAMIYFSGFTLNLMTLGGMALGVGMLLDNSIVVLENIFRLRGEGMDPHKAAIEGAGEVTGAILASTLTTLAVFLPLVFVRGMAGVMFTQLAFVVGFSLLCSLSSATTLVPMLASRMLSRRSRGAAADRQACPGGAGLARLEQGYGKLLRRALGQSWFVLACVLLLLFLSMIPVRRIGAELMPQADEGEVRVNAEMEVGTHLDLMERQFLQMEDIIRREVPEISSMVSTIAGGSPWRATGGHAGMFRISLVPLAQRDRSSEEVAAALRPVLSRIPGVTVRTRTGQGHFVLRMATAGGERLIVEVRGHDFATADALAARVESLVAGVAGVTDVQVSRDAGVPERRIRIDRAKASDLGLTVQDVARTLEIVLGGVSAGFYREEGNEYRILVKSSQAEHLPLNELLDLQAVNQQGMPVVLRNLVDVEPASGPVMIERKDRERIITVAANISGRDLSSIVADIQEQLRELAVPRGFSIAFGGDYEEQQQAFRELLLSFVLALVLVYMVMACQFESLRDPLVVMFSVPLASAGVIAALWLTGTTFNVQSFIGCIMLAGIVVNNAILLVDQTNLLRRRDGLSLQVAVCEAGRRRLRPILMTALTTMLGLTPLALGIGEGGEAQAPMARVVIGGLLSASVITLIVVPVAYLLLNRWQKGKLTRPSGI